MFHCVQRWDEDSLSGAGLRGARLLVAHILRTDVADIFVSYTSSDRDWAFWIGQQLEKLGHTAHIHEWEISGGGDISAWMEEHHDGANHILCVISEAYLKAPYSSWERRAAQWVATTKRPHFALPVFIEACESPTLLASLKRCDLYGSDEGEARQRLATFMKPASRPIGPILFPGVPKPSTAVSKTSVAFPGGARALSNIPISIPRCFLGRDEVFADIKVGLAGDKGRVAITALYGLRGVGKTTLAAAYAHRHRADYLVTWWIRAETESTMRADLVGLGVRLGWVAGEEKEEPALAAVMERLRDEGRGILLIFDNAVDADSIESYFPAGGDAQVLVTSNSYAWRDVASPLQIDIWPDTIGADYLTSRTGRAWEREVALSLSKALGGLPLAHEQAAAYCERVGISFVDYLARFERAPAKLLGSEKDAPRAYHNRMTVAKTFALAIDEAAKLHPAAEPLIVYAALLAPESIPLYLFSEAREVFGEPLASALADDGLDEAVAALRAFALVHRETIADERDPSTTTDCIRLHRLVRQVAAGRRSDEVLERARREWMRAVAEVYSATPFNDPKAWPRARRLDALALGLVGEDRTFPKEAKEWAAILLDRLAFYRIRTQATYDQARSLLERVLAIIEAASGSEHPDTATCINNVGYALKLQGDLSGAQPYYERALTIRKKALGSEHRDVAQSLNNLGQLLQEQGNLSAARPLLEQALVIHENTCPEDPDTATCLNNLAMLLKAQGDISGARPLYERALAIDEKVLGPEHPDTAIDLVNLAELLGTQGDLTAALPLAERALAIFEKVLGPDHPTTATSLGILGKLMHAQGNLVGALAIFERAFEIYQRGLGPQHPRAVRLIKLLAQTLAALDRESEAEALCRRFGVKLIE